MNHFHTVPQANLAFGIVLLDSGSGVLSFCFLLTKKNYKINFLAPLFRVNELPLNSFLLKNEGRNAVTNFFHYGLSLLSFIKDH